MSNRGFATTFALFLVALVGAAMLAVTTLMMTDVRRSTRIVSEAQLRQLLHAGAVAVMCHVTESDSPPNVAWTLPLPPELQNSGFAVTITRNTVDPRSMQFLIDARHSDNSLTQSLHFVREVGEWRLAWADLQQ